MATIILKYDARNPLIKSILNSAILAGATVEEKQATPYNKEFVKKIKESERQFEQGNYKTIKTADLWK